jgi:hypothetical protein
MQLELKIQNLDKVREALAKLSGKQARQAYAKAINDTGFMVRKAMQDELRKFDRVTPFIEKSPKLLAATPEKLSATILPTLDSRNLPSAGGKVGVDPQQVLQAQEFGGKRADKRSESALRRAGILPRGYQTAIPREPYPGSDDGRGNLRGAFLQQLISYFQAYSEVGFKANMTDKRKRAIHKGTAKTTGRRYFVSYGKLRGQHLAAGIWAAQGTHGADVRPVLMFVRAGNYRPRISMDGIAKASGAQEHLDKRMRFRVRELAESL